MPLRRATPDRDLYKSDQLLVQPIKKPAERCPWLLPGFNHPNTFLRQEINQQPYIVDHAAEGEMEPPRFELF